jgi:nitroreductase
MVFRTRREFRMLGIPMAAASMFRRRSKSPQSDLGPGRFSASLPIFMNPNLSAFEAALRRRSIKSFKPDPIPDDLRVRLIEAMQSAPSSFNLQPTRVVLIDDPEQKKALSAVAWNQRQITDAPLTLVFAVSIRGWEKTMDAMLDTAVRGGGWPQKFADFVRQNAPGFQNALGDKEREYAIKDAMIMATTAALVAESFGLGTCYMNGWSEDGVKKVLGVEGDPDIAIALVLPVGYPVETPKSPGRLPKDLIFFRNRLK